MGDEQRWQGAKTRKLWVSAVQPLPSILVTLKKDSFHFQKVFRKKQWSDFSMCEKVHAELMGYVGSSTSVDNRRGHCKPAGIRR